MNKIRVLEIIVLLTISIFWCEVGYYYFIFHNVCPGWPVIQKTGDYLRLLVVADTHIMGMVNSARIDKWRREWQMKQAFRISLRVYKPDVVIFLGDLFDEASFSSDQEFETAMTDFNATFGMDVEQERIVIPGNHDVGFHDQMTAFPHLLSRFTKKFGSVENIAFATRARLAELNIIVSNSMSFYNDTCQTCSKSIARANMISSELEQQKKTNASNFVEPILLHHIPLYRLDDTNCDYPNSLRKKVHRANIEGDDVMHSITSSFILSRLKPRIVISGHTHMLCQTHHTIEDQNYEELTISSFNHKYAEKRPGFLLLSVSKDAYLTQHCYLVEEWVIVCIYLGTLALILIRIAYAAKGKKTL